MADATVAPVPGNFRPYELEPVLDVLERFLGVERAPELDTVLATVLFTDLVGSSQRQASLGDRAWKILLERHHALIREALGRCRVVAGDPLRARDRPTRPRGAGARSPCRSARRRMRGDRRQAGRADRLDRCTDRRNARATEVLVSQTVKDLAAGSGFAFDDRGEHEVKGIPDRRRLHRASLADRPR